MKSLDLPGALHNLVSKAFTKAKKSESLVFSSTELATIHTRQGVPLQLRYCPALAKKPKPASENASKPKPDPFENPQADLLVASVPKDNPSHILVLNKYPVIPNHFILATKSNKPQTDVLEEDDLAVTHACLEAWQHGDDSASRRLFAFFNSGEHSGASQAHRHLQFLPYEDMAGQSQKESDSEWTLLIDRMTEPLSSAKEILHDPSLPFIHYAAQIPRNPSPSLLHQTYLKLYRLAVDAVQPSASTSASKDPASAASISYNLALTTTNMAICPRRSESASVPSGSSTDEGEVAINGTILAGTLMVKDEGEWENLKHDSDLLSLLLSTIGIPVKGTSGGHHENKL